MAVPGPAGGARAAGALVQGAGDFDNHEWPRHSINGHTPAEEQFVL